MDYIERIKQIKSERKITNDMLAEATGIPLGTLSKILAGVSDSPKLSNIVAICEALGCNLDYIVNGIPENTNNYTLNRGEIKLIEDYRRLDNYGQELVTLVLDKECQRITHSGYAEKGEPSGRSKVISASDVQRKFGNGLSAAGNGLGKRKILLYDLPVSAGTGEFLDEADGDEISIPDNVRTRTADYALRISGNSMEPKYRDGDIVLVEECDSIEVGELGIFVLDGNGFFKVFGSDRLISLNSDYGPIMLKDFENVNCCGRVIGKLKRK